MRAEPLSLRTVLTAAQEARDSNVTFNYRRTINAQITLIPPHSPGTQETWRTITNFLNRALIRRKGQQNGDTAGGWGGGSGYNIERFSTRSEMKPTFNSSFLCTPRSGFLLPTKVKPKEDAY